MALGLAGCSGTHDLPEAYSITIDNRTASPIHLWTAQSSDRKWRIDPAGPSIPPGAIRREQLFYPRDFQTQYRVGIDASGPVYGSVWEFNDHDFEDNKVVTYRITGGGHDPLVASANVGRHVDGNDMPSQGRKP